MASESDDVFARVFTMYEEVQEAVVGSEAYRKAGNAASYVAKLGKSAAGIAGRSAWVIGTALVIGILPALFACERELNPVPEGAAGELPPLGDVSDAAAPAAESPAT